jgi:O-antigen ligase
MGRRTLRPPTPGAALDALTATLLFLAVSAAVLLFGGVQPRFAGPVLLTVFGLALFVALRTLWRDVPESAGPRAVGWLALLPAYAIFRAVWPSEAPWEARVEALLAVAYWVCLALWARLGGAGERWRFWLGAFLLLVAAGAMYALAIHLRGERWVLWMQRPDAYRDRASGTFGSPNHFAHFLVIGFSFALAMVLSPRAGGGLRLVSAYALFVIPPALLLTLSRGGVAGALVAVVIVPAVIAFARSSRRHALAAIGLPLLAAGIAYAVWQSSPKWQSRLEAVTQGDMLRPRMWKDTLTLWKAAPLWGHGPGAFPYVFQEHRHHYFEPNHRPSHAHCEPLEWLAEHGVLGTAWMAGLGLWFLGGLLRRHLRPGRREADVAWAAGLSAAWAASGVQSLVEFNFRIPGNVLLLVSLTGLAMARLRAQRGESPPTPPGVGVSRGRRVAAAVGALALLLALWEAWRWMRIDQLRLRWLKESGQPGTGQGLPTARTAARLDPGYNPAHVFIGETLQRQAFWLKRVPDQAGPLLAEAEIHLERALRNNRRDLGARTALARVRVLQGRGEEAAALMEEGVRLSSRLVFTRLDQARVLLDLGRRHEALHAFQKARELDPYSEAAWAGVHTIKRRLGLPIHVPVPPTRPTPPPPP